MHFLSAKLIAFSLLFSISIPLISQKTPFKYGKISVEELSMDSCHFYSEAKAMVIGELGVISFNYSSDNGFQIVFDHTVRIKIFSQEADDLGNIQIKTYKGKGSNKEEVKSIKGVTYNLEDGKVAEVKLKKSDVYTEELNERWEVVKFAMPAVKAGSIIEYSYSISSDFISNLRNWEFQKNIPVQWSELNFTIPEYFFYQTIFRGYGQMSINETSTVQETFTYKYKEEPQLDSRLTSGSGNKQSSFSSTSKKTRWVAENLEPLKQEPFMTSFQDYLFQVEFQLEMIKYPNEPQKVVAGSWGKVNSEFLDNESFGKLFQKGLTVTDLSESTKLPEEPFQKAVYIYELIKQNLIWNDFYSVFSGQSPRQLLKSKSGSVADINLNLISALNNAGLEAYPVLVSTRSNGKMHPVYPSYERMNYVITAVNIDGNTYFADASQRSLQFGLLPEYCMNGQGWEVNPNGGRWVNLQTTQQSEMAFVKLTLKDDQIVGSMSLKKGGYLGHLERQTIQREGMEKYLSMLNDTFRDWEISVDSLSYENPYEEVKIDINLNKTAISEKLFINPVLLGIKENPFKNDKRKMPVDIPYGRQLRYLFTLEIPEGYQVDEIPSSLNIALPENGGMFRYLISQSGSSVSINMLFSMNKLFYPVEEYQLIKQFYTEVAAKSNEIIVLKKL